MKSVSTARIVAYEVIRDVDERDAYANLAMPHAADRHHLQARDVAFATELAYGALRMRGLYDAVIGSAAKRDVGSLDREVERVLILGVHQVLGMRVEAHAAVSQTVELAVHVGMRRASGIVNAVMRRVAEASREQWLERVAAGAGRAAIATRHSHPEWIVGALELALATDGRAGQVEALVASHNEPAPVTLAERPGLVEPGEWDGIEHGRGRWAATAVRLDRGTAPGTIAAVKEGRAGVQDEGSQAAALALAAAPLEGTGDERWLDMCAGPGGKAALLGAVAAQRGARLDAIELHEHRVGLVRDNVRALPEGTVTVHQGDATAWGQDGYDRVLLDAPCTGLGALRRRPEARWRRSPGDLDALLPLQAALLARALRVVRPGGVVAYVTCSPLLEETRYQVERAVAEAGGMVELVDAREVLRAVAPEPQADGPWGGRHRDVQMWTHAHGTDSMYVALLRRRAASQ